MRGETIGYGVVGYDCVGNKGFVQKIEDLENFTFPNRRDETSSETQAYSYGGTVRAAMTSTNEVGNTHEVFDLTDAVYKTDKCDFKNIIEKGRLLGITGTKLTAPNGVNQDCDETDAEIESHGAHVELGTLVSGSYQPFTPVSSKDPDIEGHNYSVNNKVAENNVKIGPIVIEGDGVKDYRPAGFAPNYYSMGMMVAGIDNIPSWMKSFAIVTSSKKSSWMVTDRMFRFSSVPETPSKRFSSSRSAIPLSFTVTYRCSPSKRFRATLPSPPM